MIVDRVLRDLDLPGAEDREGNPLRGSRLGRCARQSAYMLWPHAYPPDPLPARTKLVFAFGTMIHDLVRKEFRRVCPGTWGAEEMRFHFKVPLTVKEYEAAALLLFAGKEARFRCRIGRGDVTQIDGVYLDGAEPAIYIPLHVDGIADAGDFGLAPCEIKSMTTAGFRHALAGRVDYSYRVQMAAAIDATGLDTQLYVAVRKDTCHLLEVIYSRRVETVRVTFTKQSQLVRVAEVEMDDWEAAQVEHPFEPALIEEARARVKRILLATPTALPAREHGPVFTCPTCNGTATQVNAKATGLPLKRGPKPCEDCAGGQLEEAELPWNCRYCAFIQTCWADAKPRLDFDREARPHFWVTRAAFAASGIPA